MNTDIENFQRVLAEDGASVVMGPEGGIDAIRFAGGGAVGWRNPGDASDRETHLGARLVRTVAKVHADIAKIQTDVTRTDTWKAEQVARIAAEAAAAFTKARLDADAAIAAFDEADRREAMPPAIASGDMVGGLLDREVRDLVRGLDHDEQVELAQALMDGRHPQTLAALLRSPWPVTGVLGEVLTESWQRQQLVNDPQGARLRQRAQKRIGWLRGVVDQTQGALPQTKPTLAQARNAAITERAA